MLSRCSLFACLIFSCCLISSASAQNSDAEKNPHSRWEKAIGQFEAADRKAPPQPGQVLFIGSSSIRLWDLKKWFPDVEALNRGFGGSEVADSVYFYDRIVKPYAPRAIVMYAGDNDLAHDKSPETVAADYALFVKKVHSDFPETKLIYVAVKPSLKRWSLIEQVRKTNEMIKQMSEQNDKLVFLDIDTPMIGEDGNPRPELYVKDGLHLSDAGYQVWSDLLRPYLIKQIPRDQRLQSRRDIYDAYHPWNPPTNLEDWKAEAARIRRQILVSNGLWPLPEKTPLEPVIHGKLDRGDYTVEKVYFRSRPGHYVTGSLYRPKVINGKVPGVLCPHGHWQDGRFYDAGDGAQAQLESGAEQFKAGAHSPLQARMVQLARMGCIVFHYDMIGYADSQPLDHRTGFNDADAALRLHNLMGLQTWNSIRALDFIESLPEVDSDRLAVTGASGGGTQTMILAAVDDRVDVAFPAVMVSTGMQGGCVCENASYLRQGVNNVAFAALFAPKPQAMSGADDWTIEIESKGLPELKQVYALFGKSANVHAAAFPQFKHNYNQVSREVMFNWFNDHLELGIKSPVKQTDFEPLTPQELSVFNEDHALPGDALQAADLRELMTKEDEVELEKWLQDSEQYEQIVSQAAEVILNDDGLNPLYEVLSTRTQIDATRVATGVVTHSNVAVVPTRIFLPATSIQGTVFWLTGREQSKNEEQAIRKLITSGYRVVLPELFLVNTSSVKSIYQVNQKYPGYTYCYNHPLIVERVRDILSVLEAIPLEEDEAGKGLNRFIVADGGAGPWALLASTISNKHRSDHWITDLEGFSFEEINSIDDPNLLPGALKYGGLAGFFRLQPSANRTIAGTGSSNVWQEFSKSGDNNAGSATIIEANLSATDIASHIIKAE